MPYEILDIKTKVMVLVLLVTLLFPCLSVSAYPDEETISLNTGDIYLVSGVKVKLTCNLPVELSTGSHTMRPGETSTWHIQINTPGTVSISVYIPSPVDEWYSMSEDFTSITGLLHIPIISGLSATLKINPSASLTIDGPGSLSPSSVSLDYMGSSKSFTVSSYSSASNKAKITVYADFKLDLSVGLSISLFLFSQQIASTNIGKFPMSPTVSETITVSVPFDPIASLLGNPFFIILGLASILGLIVAVGAHRARKKVEAKMKRGVRTPPPQPVQKEKPTPARTSMKTVYCINCGEKLPSHATYCRKCGKKVE